MKINVKKIILHFENGISATFDGDCVIENAISHLSGKKIVKIEIQEEVVTKKSIIEIIKSMF